MSDNIPLHEWHHGWRDVSRQVARAAFSRRQFMRGAAAAAAGLALSPLTKLGSGFAAGPRPVTSGVGLPDHPLGIWDSQSPIKHVVILCQENRSFDHYFGSFADQLGTPGNRADGFDPNATYFASNNVTKYKPFYLDYFCDYDPDHSWEGSHTKWNNNAMDGWVKGEANDQPFALGYYRGRDHIYHKKLAQTFAVADRYHCSQISQTLPNRLYLWTGTSGWAHLDLSSKAGLPFNNPSVSKPPPTLDWPTMAEAFETASLPWKCYTVADGSVPSPIGSFNPLIYFKAFQSSPVLMAKALTDFNVFLADLAAGQLPAVSWIITEAAVSEHPPAPPDMGQLLAARVVRALMESTAWESTALFLTYDEGGGYFDHVAPPGIYEEVPSGTFSGEAVGPAFRVPLVAVSPWARPQYVFAEPSDHTSVLKFLEWNFDLDPMPTIAQDRRNNLSDLRGLFDFSPKEPAPFPMLPDSSDLFDFAKETVLTSDVHRGVVECGTTIPRWLPPLLGRDPLIPYPTPSPA